ncbi:MAG: hypothetical protein ACTSRU_09840 [Candidatus Hodarchaeales archaeon]
MKYKSRNDHGITSLDNRGIRKLLNSLGKEFRGAIRLKTGRFTTHPSRVRVVVKRIAGSSIFLVLRAKTGSQQLKIACRSLVVRNLVLQFLRNYNGLMIAFEYEVAS